MDTEKRLKKKVIFFVNINTNSTFALSKTKSGYLDKKERCQSGRTGLPAKELYPLRVPGVRIPSSPQNELQGRVAQLDRASAF